MVQHPSACILLMLSAFRLLQITSADHRSVRPGENVTLHCNATDYSEMSWYRLRADEVELLMSVKRAKVTKIFVLSYVLNESHFSALESRGSASLKIIGVGETDLGFYYCGGQTEIGRVQFGKPIRLEFTDDDDGDDDIFVLASDTQLSTHSGIFVIILSCVCTVSLSVAIICSCLCCSVLQDKCSSTRDSNKEEAELRPHDLTSVTYTSAS